MPSHHPRCAMFNEPPGLRDPKDCNCGAIPPLDVDNPEPIFPAVELLRLRPGDRLLLHSPHRLSPSDTRRIYAQLRERYPDHEVLIVDGGNRLSVLREEDDAES